MEIAIFHEFHKPPYGGGNQFLLALKKEFEARGIRVLQNKVTANTQALLFNSFNFDFDQLRKVKQRFSKCKMIHRVDGPIGLYRGADDEIDKSIANINNEIADATVFQSKFSMNEMKKISNKFARPVVITNAVDSTIFNCEERTDFVRDRKFRIIAVSWSDNLNKGGPLYLELEKLLDWDKYEFMFVGRTQMKFTKIKVLPAVDSVKLATLLKQSDVYITASKNDPCSNSLIEALSCGLPAAYLNSGGHPEIVKQAGEKFEDAQGALVAIDKIAKNYDAYQRKIAVENIKQIADKYIAVCS